MRVSKDDWRFLELTVGWGVFGDMVKKTIGKGRMFLWEGIRRTVE